MYGELHIVTSTVHNTSHSFYRQKPSSCFYRTIIRQWFGLANLYLKNIPITIMIFRTGDWVKMIVVLILLESLINNFKYHQYYKKSIILWLASCMQYQPRWSLKCVRSIMINCNFLLNNGVCIDWHKIVRWSDKCIIGM